MSKFVVGVSGALLALVLPMRVATATMIRARGSFAWLSSLSPKQLSEFSKSHLAHFRSGRALLHGSHLPTANSTLHWIHLLPPWPCPTTPLQLSGSWTAGQSETVSEEGRAYAEVLRLDSRSVKQGNALRNSLDGTSESVSEAAV